MIETILLAFVKQITSVLFFFWDGGVKSLCVVFVVCLGLLGRCVVVCFVDFDVD